MARKQIIKAVKYKVSHKLEPKKQTAKKPIKKQENTMNTQEKIDKIAEILQEPTTDKNVKKVKRDKSLIEKDESKKIIMVDETKMLLND